MLNRLLMILTGCLGWLFRSSLSIRLIVIVYVGLTISLLRLGKPAVGDT